MMRPTLLGLALTGALAGCRTTRGSAARPLVPENGGEAAFRVLFERAMTHRDTAALTAALAPAFTFHAGGQTARVPRRDLFTLAGSILRGFPDIEFHVEQVVSEGDVTAARLRFTGTHRGTWHGIAPTGRRVAVTEMLFCRVADRRLAECWQEWDEAGLRKQLTVER